MVAAELEQACPLETAGGGLRASQYWGYCGGPSGLAWLSSQSVPASFFSSMDD